MKILRMGAPDTRIPTDRIRLAGGDFTEALDLVDLRLSIENGPSGKFVTALLAFYFHADEIKIDLPDALPSSVFRGLALDLESYFSANDEEYELEAALEEELCGRTSVMMVADKVDGLTLHVTIGEAYDERFAVPLAKFGTHLVVLDTDDEADCPCGNHH